MHSLLKRQIQRHLGGLDSVPKHWALFLAAVEEAYNNADSDRTMIERSLELSSKELSSTNAEMRITLESLKRAEERLERLNRTFLDIGPDFEQNVQRLTAACGEILEASCAVYSRFQHEVLVTVGQWQTPNGFETVSRPGGHLLFDAVQSGNKSGAFWVRDIPQTQYFKTDPNAAKFGFQTCAGQAVSCFGHPVGSLCLLYKEDAPFDESDRRMLEIVATAIGIEEDRKRVEEDRKRLASFPELNPTPIVEVDMLGKVTYLNPEARRLFPDLQTLGVRHLFLAGYDLIAVQLHTQGMMSREMWIGQVCYKQVMHYVAQSQCIRVYAFDVTDHKLALEELINAKETAEEASRTKDTFLANMSHELRTPLNSIIGFTNILLKNKSQNLRDQDISFLKRVLSNGKHLLILINDILDLSKIEARRMELALSPVSLEELVKEVLGEMESQARECGIRMVSKIPTYLRPIRTDRDKLKQVLINLIGNAIKFTKEGSVTVQVISDVQHSPIRINVTDTGIGIPQEHLAKIFNAFQQVDASYTRKYGGTGLGLAISRSLCGLMDYPLEVESKHGEGSTFSISLHDISDEDMISRRLGFTVSGGEPGPQAEKKIPEREHPVSLQGKTILVIDDESDSRILIMQYLEDFGCSVIAADSGDQGLRMAKEFHPDLITLDLMMPKKSGWEVLKEIKASPELKDIPVVIISIVAKEKRGSIARAMHVLQKPIPKDELLQVLEKCLEPRQDSVLIVEDDKNICELLSDFLTDEGFKAQTATNGQEALNKLENFTPDVVLIDLMMPVMNGMTLLGHLRSNPKWAHLPAIVVTAKNLSAADLNRLHSETLAVIHKGNELKQELRKVLTELLKNKKVQP